MFQLQFSKLENHSRPWFWDGLTMLNPPHVPWRPRRLAIQTKKVRPKLGRFAFHGSERMLGSTCWDNGKSERPLQWKVVIPTILHTICGECTLDILGFFMIVDHHDMGFTKLEIKIPSKLGILPSTPLWNGFLPSKHGLLPLRLGICAVQASKLGLNRILSIRNCEFSFTTSHFTFKTWDMWPKD